MGEGRAVTSSTYSKQLGRADQVNMLAAMTSSSTQHAAVGEGEGLQGHDAGGEG